MNRSLLCLLAANCALAALPIAHAAPVPSGNRYLFIVETSAAMQRLENGGRQALFDLLQSGLKGHMRTGDTFGVWTYGKDLRAGLYPMQAWGSNTATDLASHASLFVKSQKYEKRTRMTPVYAGVSNVVYAVKDVHVIIISASGTEWSGTPFDLDINTAYRLKANQVLEQKRPLITTLIAANGRIVDWSVTLAGDSIRLPPRPAPVQTAQPSATSTAPPPQPALAPPPPPPIIMTGKAASPTSDRAPGSLPIAAQELGLAAQAISDPKTAPQQGAKTQEPPAAIPQTALPPGPGTAESAPGSPLTAKSAQPIPMPPSTPPAGSPPIVANVQNPAVEEQRPINPAVPTALSPGPLTAPVRSAPPQTPGAAPGSDGATSEPATAAATAVRPGQPPTALKPAAGKRPETLGAERLPLAGAPASKPLAPSTGPVAPSTGLLNPKILLALGFVLAVLGMGLIAVFLRRYRVAAQMSYITRSMDQR